MDTPASIYLGARRCLGMAENAHDLAYNLAKLLQIHGYIHEGSVHTVVVILQEALEEDDLMYR